jgi:molybdopterin guanine dinucleotide-containing S/N-oxide reductase-like protein
MDGLSRRTFLKGASALVGVSALEGVFKGATPLLAAVEKQVVAETKILPTSCTYDCGGRCILKAHVKDGVITRFDTDEDVETEDNLQLRACYRGRSWRNRLYSPHRLKYPMKRVGKRGSGKWERISWEQAIDEISRKLINIKEKYGDAAVFDAAHSGGYSSVRGELFSGHPMCFWSVARRFHNLFGSRVGWWDVPSFEGAMFAAQHMCGQYSFNDMNEPDSLVHSKLIIFWGYDPVKTIQGTNTAYYLMKAKERGAKFIGINPEHVASIAHYEADWIPITPTTDTAMALAMAYVMVEEDLYDKEFIEKYTVGFDQYVDYLYGRTSYAPSNDKVERTPEWAEKITGVSASAIRDLAREYATTKPAALIAGWGPQRTERGEEFSRAAFVLTLMAGSMGVMGGWSGLMHGGINLFMGSYTPTIDPSLPPELKKTSQELVEKWKKDKGNFGYLVQALMPGMLKLSQIKVTKIADAVAMGEKAPKDLIGCPEDAKQPNVKAIYTCGWNWLNQDMNVKKAIDALTKDDLELSVVHELFLTPTAQYADYVLPINTHFEREDDYCTPWLKGYYLLFRNNCIKSLYETKSDHEIFCMLAKRIEELDPEMKGFHEKYNEGKTSRQWLDEWEKIMDVWLSQYGVPKTDWKEVQRKGFLKLDMPKGSKPWIAYKDQIQNGAPFPTPSGKIEIYSEKLEKMDFKKTRYGDYVPPLPTYIEAKDSIFNKELAKKYPLQLLTPHPRFKTHSMYYLNPWINEISDDEMLMMNAGDAKARGIRHGDMVKVYNDRGTIMVQAKVSERIMPGVVRLYDGSWSKFNEEGIDVGGACDFDLKFQKLAPKGAFNYVDHSVIRGGNPNTLIGDTPSPTGAFNYNGFLVEIDKA